MASTIAVRKELNRRGISNNRIGYDPKTQTVLVDNKPFLKPQQITEGTSYADPQSFNQAYQQLQQPTFQANQVNNEIEGMPQGMSWQERLQYLQQNPDLQRKEYQRVTNVANLAGVTGDTEAQQRAQNYLNQFLQATGFNPESNPYDTQINQTLQGLLDRIRNPQQVSVEDVVNSPQYEAYQEQAQRQAQQAIRQAQEALGGAGFGRSTRLAERAQNIQNQANEYLQTQVLPQLISNQQQQQQRQLQNLMNALGLMQGQQGLYDTRQQREFENEFAQQRFEEQQRQFNEQLEQEAKQFAQQMGYRWASLNQDQQQFLKRMALQERGLDLEAGRLELARDQFEAREDEGQNEITAKQSADNYYNAVNEVQKAENRDQAIQYAQALKPYLTDQDYRRLLDYVDEVYGTLPLPR